MYPSIQLHPFELFILRQFRKRPLSNYEIMHFLTKVKGIKKQESYFAISQLRAKWLLNTYYDNKGNQYFALNSTSISYLNSLNSTVTVNYTTSIIQNFALEYPKPTQLELLNIKQAQQNDHEIKLLTIENLKNQKSKNTFDKGIAVLTLISTLLTLLYLIFPNQFKQHLDKITSKIATVIPAEKPLIK